MKAMTMKMPRSKQMMMAGVKKPTLGSVVRGAVSKFGTGGAKAKLANAMQKVKRK